MVLVQTEQIFHFYWYFYPFTSFACNFIISQLWGGGWSLVLSCLVLLLCGGWWHVKDRTTVNWCDDDHDAMDGGRTIQMQFLCNCDITIIIVIAPQEVVSPSWSLSHMLFGCMHDTEQCFEGIYLYRFIVFSFINIISFHENRGWMSYYGLVFGWLVGRYIIGKLSCFGICDKLWIQY